MLIGKPPFETNDVKTTYRKIRLNSYSFPENVPISNEAKSLIIKILHLNPSLRPTLDEILAHDFMHMGNAIPKLLPSSTLACAPSSNLLKQYGSGDNKVPVNTLKDENQSLNTANMEINSKTKAMTERQPNVMDELNLNNPNQPNTLRESDKDKDKKDKGMRTLAVSVYNPALMDLNGGEAVDKGPDIWVMKWVDYSTKYGLG
jgi:polo-like kinase 1